MLLWAEVVQRFRRAEGSVEGPRRGCSLQAKLLCARSMVGRRSLRSSFLDALTWPPDPITSSAGDAAAPNFDIIRDSTSRGADPQHSLEGRPTGKENFSTDYMRALFDYAYAKTKAGYP